MAVVSVLSRPRMCLCVCVFECPREHSVVKQAASHVSCMCVCEWPREHKVLKCLFCDDVSGLPQRFGLEGVTLVKAALQHVQRALNPRHVDAIVTTQLHRVSRLLHACVSVCVCVCPTEPVGARSSPTPLSF